MLKEIHADHEILADVIDMFDGTGSQAEATKRVKALEEIQVQPTNVVACAFDTTATGSGLKKGVAVKVLEALKRPVF